MSEIHPCSGCNNLWTGAATCHCSACHLTFTDMDAFVKHRVRDPKLRKNVCAEPTDVGLSTNRARPYVCWGINSTTTSSTTFAWWMP